MRLLNLPLRNLSLLFLLPLALGGCALSPQVVTIDPSLQEQAAASRAAGQPLDLRVVDARPAEDIGTRGGVYRESSRIQPANDIADAVRRCAVEGLAKRGYAIGTEATDRSVRLSVEQLSYDVSEGRIATAADITVAIRAHAERGADRYETVYRSAMNRKFPVPPTAEQNAEWINEVLGETLQRFLDDAKLHAFLRGD